MSGQEVRMNSFGGAIDGSRGFGGILPYIYMYAYLRQLFLNGEL